MTKIIKLVNPSSTVCRSLEEGLEPFSLFTPPHPPLFFGLKIFGPKNNEDEQLLIVRK